MDYKTPPLRDNYLVQYILGKVVNHVCNCELVNQANIDEMEDYPFSTFTWIDFNRQTTTDWLKQYTCVLQLDIYDSDPDRALMLSQDMYDALHKDAYRRWFKQANVVPISTTQTSNRTVLKGTNYSNRYGFDCSFLVNSGQTFDEKDLKFEYSDIDIRSVNGVGSIAESDLKVNANAKKGEMNG